MIYTSYFEKIDKLPKDVIPIAICNNIPVGYSGLQYMELAPKFNEPYDSEHFSEYYDEQVLSQLSAINVILDFSRLCYGFNVGENDICLICNRDNQILTQLVSNWLNRNGFMCETWLG